MKAKVRVILTYEMELDSEWFPDDVESPQNMIEQQKEYFRIDSVGLVESVAENEIKDVKVELVDPDRC